MLYVTLPDILCRSPTQYSNRLRIFHMLVFHLYALLGEEEDEVCTLILR